MGTTFHGAGVSVLSEISRGIELALSASCAWFLPVARRIVKNSLMDATIPFSRKLHLLAIR